MSDVMKIDFGDGVSAVDRIQRAVVMLIDQAVGRLLEMGYTREKHVNIEVHDDGMPVYVLLSGKRVYEIGFVIDLGGGPALAIDGNWLVDVKKRGFWSKLWGR